MEVPQLVRLDPMPGGICIIRQQVIDSGGSRTPDGRDASLDAFLTAIGFAIEAAFRVRFETEAGDEVLGGEGERHDGKPSTQFC